MIQVVQYYESQKEKKSMARSCTEREKETIKKNLLEACRRSWTQNGYKKTSVDELCGQAFPRGVLSVF